MKMLAIAIMVASGLALDHVGPPSAAELFTPAVLIASGQSCSCTLVNVSGRDRTVRVAQRTHVATVFESSPFTLAAGGMDVSAQVAGVNDARYCHFIVQGERTTIRWRVCQSEWATKDQVASFLVRRFAELARYRLPRDTIQGRYWAVPRSRAPAPRG